ncbi:MAG TPA: FAD-dependent oxidoreductase, partial [Planctomycetota bacterium]|nr:FAD-dependent oxidoreductase [Planctomycetota bacterium]
DAGFPVFLFERPEGIFYGFPALDEHGVKCAEHTSGDSVAKPSEVDRSERSADRERLESFLRVHLPGVNFHVTRHSVCLYTITPDRDFVVDRHPAHPNVVFAAGLSGHGFKFATVLGEILADLAVDGRTRHPIEFLRLDRPALRAEA